MNFRSFVFYFTIQNVASGIHFAIKLSAQVNIFKHIERKHGRKILQNVRTLDRLKGKSCKINKDKKFFKLCKKEHLIPTFAKMKLAQIIMKIEM